MILMMNLKVENMILLDLISLIKKLTITLTAIAHQLELNKINNLKKAGLRKIKFQEGL